MEGNRLKWEVSGNTDRKLSFKAEKNVCPL